MSFLHLKNKGPSSLIDAILAATGAGSMSTP